MLITQLHADQGGTMRQKAGIVLVVFLILIVVCGSYVTAGRALPPSNETTSITVRTSASATGNFFQSSDIVYIQGNDDLSDNPPLNGTGEGQSTISYQEDIMAISGSITYDEQSNLDTGPKTANSDNFEKQQILTYDSAGDGTEGGKMIADESILVEVIAEGVTMEESCCDSLWGADEGAVLPPTNGVIVAGSEMIVSEANVTSTTGARITADSVDTPVSMDYSVDIQDGEGTATAYVNANIQEGNGNTTAVGAEIQYSDVTTVSGLFELAKTVSYESG